MSYDAEKEAKALWQLVKNEVVDLFREGGEMRCLETEIELALVKAYLAGQEDRNGDDDD